MTERLMMHIAGRTRPLTFDPSGSLSPHVLSAATTWAGPPVECHTMLPSETVGESGPVEGECGLLVVLEGQVDIVFRSGSGEATYSAGPGSTSFVAGDDRRTVLRISGTARTAAVHLPPEWLSRLSFDGIPKTFARTRPLSRDRTMLSLVQAMCDEIGRGATTGRLYAESLSTAALSYALDHVSPTQVDVRGGLTDAQCRRLRALVQDRLHEDLSIDDLATAVGLGARHFSTLFRRAFGATPHRYLVRQRVLEGARRLERGRGDISQVALEVGFCSQSHFTTAFRRELGVTPRRYRGERLPHGAGF